MRLLILGGTQFVGRHLTAAALDRGHDVTLFNRGRTNPDLFPAAEKLRGDRDGNLAALDGQRWDAAVDTSGYVPRVVRASAERLADQVDHLTFISTISVYDREAAPPLAEDAPLGALEDETTEEITAETYGPLKALCEQAAREAQPGRTLVIRPGLIIGPHDPTDRFPYWVDRVARRDEVLAPGKPDAPVQLIDARDLAGWLLDLIEDRRTGVFNATGPASRRGFGQMLDACRAGTESDARLTWVSADFIAAHDVAPFADLPLWTPPDRRTLMHIDNQRALDAGLTFRPWAESARDTWAWLQTRDDEAGLRAGLSAEREDELLAAWHARDDAAESAEG